MEDQTPEAPLLCCSTLLCLSSCRSASSCCSLKASNRRLLIIDFCFQQHIIRSVPPIRASTASSLGSGQQRYVPSPQPCPTFGERLPFSFAFLAFPFFSSRFCAFAFRREKCCLLSSSSSCFSQTISLIILQSLLGFWASAKACCSRVPKVRPRSLCYEQALFSCSLVPCASRRRPPSISAGLSSNCVFDTQLEPPPWHGPVAEFIKIGRCVSKKADDPSRVASKIRFWP